MGFARGHGHADAGHKVGRVLGAAVGGYFAGIIEGEDVDVFYFEDLLVGLAPMNSPFQVPVAS